MEAEYPKPLELIQVLLIHRHGQRTPIFPAYSDRLFPQLWNNCHLTPYLHAFYQALEPRDTKTEHDPDHPLHELSPVVDPLHVKATQTRHSFLQSLEVYQQVQRSMQLQFQKPGQCFYGQLTDTGKRNMTTLGQRLRFLYMDTLKFLNPNLDLNEIYVRSTDYSRTIESVQYLLYGLYPMSMNRHVPLHIRHYENETMVPNDNCQSLVYETLSKREEYYKETWNETRQSLDKMNHLGLELDIENRRVVHRMYDFLACLKGHGYQFPWKIDEKDLNSFENLCIQHWGRVYTNASICKRAIGRFLTELKHTMQQRIQGHSMLKLGIYSGHDSTLLPVLCAFDLLQDFPGFGSNIAIELFKDVEQQEHVVRILYNGKVQELPMCQSKGAHWKDRKEFCTLRTFFKRMDDMACPDYALTCQMRTTNQKLKMDED